MQIREAHVDDAKVLVAAEKETAETPGLLVSRPHVVKTDRVRGHRWSGGIA